MQSTQPSTSNNDENISAETLNRRIEENPKLVLLDCRSNGESVKFSCRIRLPNVLHRRLLSGSLPLGRVHTNLADNNQKPEIILIRGELTNDVIVTNAVMKALKENSYHYSVLGESVDLLLSKFPSLHEKSDENSNSPNPPISSTPSPSSMTPDTACGPPVGYLNLGSLRIESDKASKGGKPRSEFPVEITNFLYLGNAETAQNREVLQKHSIFYVINVTSNLPNSFEHDSNFHYLRISVDDNSSHNLLKFFSEAISFIEEARSKNSACLVHCLAGISRSVTICLAYLMKTKMCSLECAYDWVQNKNASIAPNFHFMGQLTDYERTIGVNSNRAGTYPTSAPRSPSCAAEAAAAATAGLLTPPPTSCSASPQSSTHSAKSFH